MLPPNIVVLPANWQSDRQGQPIRCIIAHDTERPRDDHSSVKYLQRGGSLPDGSDRKVSIHVHIAENGDSTLMVHDTIAANHAGHGSLKIGGKSYGPPPLKYNLNTCTLGFELEHTKNSQAPYPEAQLLSAGYWINTWRERWGKIPMFKHADVDPKRRSDPIYLTIATLEEYAVKAARMLNEIPTPEKPIAYQMLVPQVVYTARSLSSRFAGTPGNPIIVDKGTVVMIGDITGDWAWLVSGVGFIPKGTAVKA